MYQGKLDQKFSKELEAAEHITTAAFSKDSSLLLVGCSTGKIYAYRVSDGELDRPAVQAAEADIAITQLQTMVNIEDNDAFLMITGGKELSVYVHNKNGDVREIDYGEDGQAYMGHEICNVQLALNNKFFMIGVPSKRALGFFGISRVQLSTKPLKWVTRVSILALFINIYICF